MAIEIYGWLTASARLLNFSARICQRLPAPVQKIIRYQLNRNMTEMTAAQWLLQKAFQLLVLILILLIPFHWWFRGLLIGVLLVYLLYQYQQRREYRQKLLKQWPATLDMIAMLIHAGLSFRAVLHTIASLSGNSVALAEIARVNRQQQAGFSIEETLDDLYSRIRHPWIHLFTAAVIQARAAGGSLADTLEQQAKQARNAQLLAAEKKAQEAAVKLLLPLLVCFFPVTFLLILGPVFLGFLQGG
ncbi:type II secretion system F family protein [Pseudidiomarina salinarum]|nr:type II secretion system F family protein [Pseudidiomarina salinarum]